MNLVSLFITNMLINGDLINLIDVFGCDFTNNAPITVVIFDGHGAYGVDLQSRLNKIQTKTLKYTSVKFNLVIIKDGQRPENNHTANFKGLSGICTHISELSKLLFQKCFVEFNTERLIYFSDCGGSFPAIITGNELPVHSINMITPYFQILGRNHIFDIKSYGAHISKKTSVWIDDNCKEEKRYFDQLQFIDAYLTQHYSKLTMHWAKHVYGTDLYFNKLGQRLTNNLNCNIIEWDMPVLYDSHLLYKWLRTEDKLFKLMADEIDEQNIILTSGR